MKKLKNLGEFGQCRVPRTLRFNAFINFHIEINRSIKTLTASILHSRRCASRSKKGKLWLERNISATGEPWGKFNRWDPLKELPKTSSFVAEMSIVRIATAFEVYFTDLKADIECWSSKVGASESVESHDRSEDLPQLPVRLFRMLGHDIDESTTKALTLCQLFLLARHALVHRDGLTSISLRKFSSSDLLRRSIQEWPDAENHVIATVCKIVGRDITITPSQVILFTDLCYRVIDAADRKFIEFAGLEGLVYLIARERLLKAEDMPAEFLGSSPEIFLSQIIQREARFTINGQKLIPILRKYDLLQECRRAFEKLSKVSAKI